MRIDVATGHYGWTVINRDTGERIPLCIWADDETGEWEGYAPGPDGKPYFDHGTGGAARTSGCCRLLLIPPDGLVPCPPQDWSNSGGNRREFL
jgi:hypothetical protein